MMFYIKWLHKFYVMIVVEKTISQILVYALEVSSCPYQMYEVTYDFIVVHGKYFQKIGCQSQIPIHFLPCPLKLLVQRPRSVS